MDSLFIKDSEILVASKHTIPLSRNQSEIVKAKEQINWSGKAGNKHASEFIFQWIGAGDMNFYFCFHLNDSRADLEKM